jgi:hypothetical protein
MRILLLLLSILCFALPALGEDEPVPAHFGPDTGFSLDEAGLRKLGDALRRDPKILDRLRPTYADCRSWVKDQSEAIRLLDATHKVINMLVESLEIPPANTEVRAHAWPVLKAGEEVARPLLPLSKMGEHFKPGARFWSLWLSEPGSIRGRSIPAFAVSRGRWHFVADPAKALVDEAFTDDVFTLFIASLHKGDHDTTYALLSEHIREQVTREELPSWLARLGFGPVKDFTWEKRSGARVLERWFVERMGTVTFQDGRDMALRIHAAPESDEYRIIYITLRSVFGIRPPSMFVPEPAACRLLAQETVQRFVDALGSGDLQEIHAHAADTLKGQLTPEVFAAAFEPHKARVEEYAFVGNGSIRWRVRPDMVPTDAFDTTEPMDPLRSKTTGPLRLRGYIVDRAVKRRVPFELQFDFGKESWLLRYADIGLPEAVSDE